MTLDFAKNKKTFLAFLLCIAVLLTSIVGCGRAKTPDITISSDTKTAEIPDAAGTVNSGSSGVPDTGAPASSDIPVISVTDVPVTGENVVTTSPIEINDPPETKKQFAFKTKVCSSFIEEILGTQKRDAWFSLVDAVMAGEDTFECPDKHTYLWMLAEFPDLCFPVLKEIVGSPESVTEMVVEGTGEIFYKIPKEEAAKKIEEFIQLVEGILNETMNPDYSDFENALSLYNYFLKTYTYDYETAALVESQPSRVNYTSAYRLLTQKNGICSEIAVAYSYLLMQAGIDASVVMNAKHEWSIIRLGDSYFHIDPTFALGTEGYLGYFMMTDEERSHEGYYKKKDFIYVAYYEPEVMPDYSANDGTFSSLWRTFFLSFDHDSKILKYFAYDSEFNKHFNEFDYTGY